MAYEKKGTQKAELHVQCVVPLILPEAGAQALRERCHAFADACNWLIVEGHAKLLSCVPDLKSEFGAAAMKRFKLSGPLCDAAVSKAAQKLKGWTGEYATGPSVKASVLPLSTRLGTLDLDQGILKLHYWAGRPEWVQPLFTSWQLDALRQATHYEQARIHRGRYNRYRLRLIASLEEAVDSLYDEAADPFLEWRDRGVPPPEARPEAFHLDTSFPGVKGGGACWLGEEQGFGSAE